MSELSAQQAIDFRKLLRVGGASAGAITACLLSVGFEPEELGDVLKRTNLEQFQDDDIGFTDFDLNRQQQAFLVNAGCEGVAKFLKWRASKSGQKEIARIYRDTAPSD